MGCAGCSISKNTGADAKGCGGGCSSNGCSSGGCNRLNTFDWLTYLELDDAEPFQYAEVSFKNGARKSFFRNPETARVSTGDWVLVESLNGYDVGRISLSGDLVRLQMKRKRCNIDHVQQSIIRRANERDLERMQEARSRERDTIVLARAIARSLKINMKIGDVEYQGDGRKATFFYTADGRVDFRELIRQYAREFSVKIEMRQIGARQESARIGGIGACGRELCCSTWLSDFKSVNTAAARYQNLAINQSKLSGQCGRLKCCLNYELDTYMDALKGFPDDAEKLQTKEGVAVLVKTDIFRQLMFYAYEHEGGRGKIYALDAKQVHAIVEMNKNRERPTSLGDVQVVQASTRGEDEPEVDYSDVTGAIELPDEERRRRKKKKKKPQGRGGEGGPQQGNRPGNPNAPREPRDNNRNQQNRPRQNGGDAEPGKNDGNNSGQRRNENRPPRRDDNRPPKQSDGNNEAGKNEGNNSRPPRNENRPPRRKDRPGNNDRRPPRDDNNNNDQPKQ
ncbi:MAG TPA: regulatory iron-sulfur-containing complex subunit RicT [Saprospiraceae bacterium]|nr:regulatory iron-sulfur-containing complex subunit RicT [Saprospiraceae bacterium]HRK81176.1 regulatory iron-sulfur-containing complex subunit RicT [Saprospiraceae bacterium]